MCILRMFSAIITFEDSREMMMRSWDGDWEGEGEDICTTLHPSAPYDSNGHEQGQELGGEEKTQRGSSDPAPLSRVHFETYKTINARAQKNEKLISLKI